MKTILLLLAIANLAFASLDKAPQNFTTSNGKLVFSDFLNANYDISFDIDQEVASVVSVINFSIQDQGKPIFDLIPNEVSVTLNGEAVKVLTVNDPDGQTTYRALDKVLSAGEYQITLRHTFDANTSFSSGSVAAGFWISDLNDRKYIEQYLPTNLEYDQYQMNFSIKIIGANQEHTIYTNGQVQELGNHKYEIAFPEYFTSSSVYFHISKAGRFSEKRFSYISKSGAIIPVTAYSKYSWNISNIENKVNSILNELESKFGDWGHPSLTIYISGMGGMEHSGATITSSSALGHELTHSYFARGVMPIDGNSGWLDEAIASWRDGGYKTVSSPNFRSTKMSAHSQYSRVTDRRAYTEGANFMAYLDYELKANGGLRAFLAEIYSVYNHSNISTAIFKLELEMFSTKDFTNQFDQYIYGKNAQKSFGEASTFENHYHPQLTDKELKELL